jgi:phosphoribosylformimino-5-aminoimidazole carboxamide ribotide isomerase
MRIIPVLDLLNGVVVRGVAGRRSEYRPLVSRFTSSCRPLDVAVALRDHFGFTELYLADLNAIQGASPAWDVLTSLQTQGFRFWVDAGVVKQEDAVALKLFGVHPVVIGLETVAGPKALGVIVQALGEQMVFSLDLRGGVPLGTGSHWKSQDAEDIAAEAVALGVRRLLILDLLRVGVGEGTGTEALCKRLAAAFPHVEISAGGGVCGVEDLRRLRDSGVQNVLVASALHDGRLTPHDLAAL